MRKTRLSLTIGKGGAVAALLAVGVVVQGQEPAKTVLPAPVVKLTDSTTIEPAPQPSATRSAPQTPTPQPAPFAPATTRVTQHKTTVQWAEDKQQKSAQRFHDNVVDRQTAAPRPNNRVIDNPRSGLRLGDGPAMQQDINMADRAPVGPPTALPGTVWADAHADARADAIFDSAKLFKSSFLPSNIPVRSDPFFRAGEHATIAPGVATKVLIDARADLSGSSSSRLIASDADPSFRLVTELEFFTLADSSEGVQARQIFGQFNNVLAGKTYTLFSDVDALPNLISNVGPNASTLISHGVLGYYFTSGPFFQIPGQRSFVAAVSIETPEDSVSALTPHIPNPYPFTVTDKTKFNSYSQVPDFAAKIRYTDNSLGHVQAATILRSIDIETDTAPTTTGMNPIPHPINTRQGVFGWGVMLSGAYYPFQSVCELQEDHVMGQIVYGEGVGSYIVDLTDSSGTPGAGSVTGSDAAFDTNNKLKALPVLAYYAGYTHWWALDKLRSTVVYSDVDLDTMAQNAPGYRHGRFVAANIIYQWGITYTDKDNKPQTHQAFVGLEYLYGQKDTVSHGSGDDHRITLSVGAKY